MKVIDKLNNALAKAGAPTNYKHFNWDKDPMSPIDALVNGPFNREPFFQIVLDYAPKLEPGDKSYVARILSKKGNYEAVPFLLSLFRNYTVSELDLWAVGNALYIIDDKSSYEAVLEICKDKTKGIARQMLMRTLARMKSAEAYQVLIDSLNDHTIKAHAIEALGRFGDTSAIPILEDLEVKKGLYEYRARITALNRLKRKLEKENTKAEESSIDFP